MDTPDPDHSAARRQRARRFTALHTEGCFLLPNAWDAGSARLLESVGFPALATTSAGIAFSYGRPDHVFHAEHPDDGRLDRAHVLDRTQQIAEAVAVPVSADLEDGYGASPDAVAETIRGAVASGAVGGNVEDFTGRSTEPLYDGELSTDRIRAARAAADESGEPFVLVGRTDALITGGSLAEAVSRANAYLAAGADCAFVPGAADEASIATLVAELDGPLNVVMGLTGGALGLAHLADLGVRRVTVGGSIARAMYAQLHAAARELHDRGTFSYAAAQLPQDDLNALFRGHRG